MRWLKDGVRWKIIPKNLHCLWFFSQKSFTRYFPSIIAIENLWLILWLLTHWLPREVSLRGIQSKGANIWGKITVWSGEMLEKKSKGHFSVWSVLHIIFSTIPIWCRKLTWLFASLPNTNRESSKYSHIIFACI